MMDFPRPKGWRKGETIIKFLNWLEDKQTWDFYPIDIPDSDWDKYFEEFLEECEK